MNLHQVLTGAVNPGDHCFSVGSVGDQRFTAYASGCDIVILGSDFERLQIIPGAKHGNIQVGCVDCSMQQGKDDCLLKIWYNVENWRTAVTSPDKNSEQSEGEIDFSFVYLAHPRAVNGFSWRKTSKYMPRASVCNVLLTCCKDNVCRLWVETFLPNDCLLYGGDCNYWTETINLTNNFKRNASSKERVQNALDVNLKHFRKGHRRSLAVVAHTGYLPHQQDPHRVHRNAPLHANALCHFHIAASINPATDIPLLPSITSLSLSESEEKSGPFVVHWLNNKELHFTLSMEVFLQQLKKSFEQPCSEASVEDSNQTDVKSDEEMDDGVDDLKISHEKKELGGDKLIPSAAVDHQIELLLSEWSKNADMLFSIHPMDGSLLVWHVDWLDEYQPGAYCNSPSACFVASDGQYLRLYEAVIDAKKLLYELSSPEISKYVGEVFNIVSQQSTARPGCIIALDPITKLQGRKTQLLHVFQEDFILNNLEKKSLGKGRLLSDEGKEEFYM
ncbi:DmX-like protein 1 [Camelus dromedarius]|uniref:DmX-like protein 1 n=1 Tax=Camelus dromedarius TaxID=9838 RepID=A0A5N4EBW9_CAMDR|nr:DmX-like protein 1 [Camelus dromedarius]